jgi:hypothetical protein
LAPDWPPAWGWAGSCRGTGRVPAPACGRPRRAAGALATRLQGHPRFAGELAAHGAAGLADLASLQIPLSARLMAVVDVYDALVSHRVYKPAFTHQQALDVMRKGAARISIRTFWTRSSSSNNASPRSPPSIPTPRLDPPRLPLGVQMIYIVWLV